jgi:hydrogenase nickel incorporation protein HypA/HybF
MHELSIAEAIVEVAVRHAAGRRVSAVEVRVGALRQVVPEALEFAFSLVAEGTALDGARLQLVRVAARGRCRACDADCVMDDFPLRCVRCGSLEMDLLAGEELSVEASELDDGETVTSEGTSHDSHV